jgi:UDP-3-O-[3-hydroxymyristoyl] N-acetylglucosamine deacetylase
VSDATPQHTVTAPATLAGVGLHTGASVRVTVQPAAADHGLVFVRTDLPGAPEIPARHASINAAALTRRTELTGPGGASVATIEHLLAACFGLGIDNARFEIDGPEVPILDGSALPWTDLLQRVGRTPQAAPRRPLRLRRPVSLIRDTAEIIAVPAERLHATFFADLSRAGMQNQAASFTLGRDDFAQCLAPARTFTFHEDVEKLRAAGLIRGGSLECAIILKDGAPFQTEYRLPNELACHKLLDLIGDLAILGRPVAAMITARATGHALHHAFVQQLLEELYDDE